MGIVDLFEGVVGGFIPDFDKWVGNGKGGYKGVNRVGSGYARKGQKAFNKNSDNKKRALLDYKEATRYAGSDRYKF